MTLLKASLIDVCKTEVSGSMKSTNSHQVLNFKA